MADVRVRRAVVMSWYSSLTKTGSVRGEVHLELNVSDLLLEHLRPPGSDD